MELYIVIYDILMPMRNLFAGNVTKTFFQTLPFVSILCQIQNSYCVFKCVKRGEVQLDFKYSKTRN